MSKVFLPKRRGYHIVVDGNLVKQNVTADMSDSVVNVKYVKDQQGLITSCKLNEIVIKRGRGFLSLFLFTICKIKMKVS